MTRISTKSGLMAVSLALILFPANSALAQISVPRPIPSPSLPRPVPSTLPTLLPQLSCPGPDPAAQRIDVQIVRRETRFRGRVQITGLVRNVGRAAYQSDPNQQVVYLSEKTPGGSRANVVAQQAFQNLLPGQEVQVIFERDWNSSSPAEGEFPPTYQIRIGYDPDIYIDGNPRNDDCNTANNQRERSGSVINALFR